MKVFLSNDIYIDIKWFVKRQIGHKLEIIQGTKKKFGYQFFNVSKSAKRIKFFPKKSDITSVLVSRSEKANTCVILIFIQDGFGTQYALILRIYDAALNKKAEFKQQVRHLDFG